MFLNRRKMVVGGGVSPLGSSQERQTGASFLCCRPESDGSRRFIACHSFISFIRSLGRGHRKTSGALCEHLHTGEAPELLSQHRGCWCAQKGEMMTAGGPFCRLPFGRPTWLPYLPFFSVAFDE